MSSFDSVNGPSRTARLSPWYSMRQPFELACRPEASSSTPAFASSSWYAAISAKPASCGMTPASESFVALTMIMNRMVLTPLVRVGVSLYWHVERGRPGSTRPPGVFSGLGNHDHPRDAEAIRDHPEAFGEKS